jgi:hypothetical protein
LTTIEKRTVQLRTSLTPTQVEAITAIATEQQISVSAVVRQAVALYLKEKAA